MPGDRVTVSLDEDAKHALEGLTERTDESRSELIREAIAFYAANFESARASDSDHLQTYYEMLSTGEHVLLDVDLLHAFLNQVERSDAREEEYERAGRERARRDRDDHRRVARRPNGPRRGRGVVDGR